MSRAGDQGDHEVIEVAPAAMVAFMLEHRLAVGPPFELTSRGKVWARGFRRDGVQFWDGISILMDRLDAGEAVMV